jgi:hypothetical protein
MDLKQAYKMMYYKRKNNLTEEEFKAYNQKQNQKRNQPKINNLDHLIELLTERSGSKQASIKQYTDRIRLIHKKITDKDINWSKVKLFLKQEKKILDGLKDYSLTSKLAYLIALVTANRSNE